MKLTGKRKKYSKDNDLITYKTSKKIKRQK